MKKITSLLLIAIMLFTMFSLTACEQKDIDILNKAFVKTNSLDSMEAEIKINMNVASSAATEGNYSIALTYGLKAEGAKSQTPKVLSTLTSTNSIDPSSNLSIDIFTDGTYIYYPDQQIKAKLTEDTSKDDLLKLNDSLFGDITEEVLGEAKFVEGEDGTKSISFDIDNDVFDEIYEELIATVSSSLTSTALDETNTQITITSASMKATVNADGYISKLGLDFTMFISFTTDGENVTLTSIVSTEAEYKNPGTPVTVTPPTGYADYEELNLAES